MIEMCLLAAAIFGVSALVVVRLSAPHSCEVCRQMLVDNDRELPAQYRAAPDEKPKGVFGP